MKTAIPLAVCLVCLLTAASGVAQERRQPSYEKLLQRVQQGHPTVDFTALRMAYTETSSYAPYDTTRHDREPLFRALRMQDYGKALSLADKALQKNYLDIKVHFVAAHAYIGLNKPDKATFHQNVMGNLIDSILRSGDGKTPETAFVVITVLEDYDILDLLGITAAKQALLRQHGQAYDRIEGVDERTKAPVTLYFNVSKPFYSPEKSR